jgi:hypothetical protein
MRTTRDRDRPRLHVRPRVGEIPGAQRRDVLKERGLAQAEAPVLLEDPDRNPGPDDAWLAPADAGCALDAGEGAADITRHDLEQTAPSRRWCDPARVG